MANAVQEYVVTRQPAASDPARTRFPRLLGNASRPVLFLVENEQESWGRKAVNGREARPASSTVLIAPNLPAGFHWIYSQSDEVQK